MALPQPRLFNPKTDKHLLDQMAQIHAACITNDKQLATFLPPLSHTRMMDYWNEICHDIEKGRTAMTMQLTPGENGETEGKEVMGYVCLMMPPSETGPFRGEVNKLMVSPNHRYKGVARRVMEKLEEVAKEKRRTLLILDTTIGLPAEQVYPKLGWTEWGVLPKYGISPADGTLVDEKFFYKHLEGHDSWSKSK